MMNHKEENFDADVLAVEIVESEKTKEIVDFTKYPREFVKYRWYRPLLVTVLTYMFATFFGVLLVLVALAMNGGDYSQIIEIATGGYDDFNAYSTLGSILTLGSAAVFIPAIALANMMVGGRTFKSYESSRGGWNYRIFFKCMLIAVIISAIPITIDNIFFIGRLNTNQFTVTGFILCTILGPMQCIAEEYEFRGIIMQGFGSWFKIPILSVVLQAAVFASMHPYDAIGVAEIAVSGVCMGLVAWISHGIEASSAIHISNNMAIFYTVGFGYAEISSTTSWHDFIYSVCIDIIYLAVIVICRKRGMFEDVKCDDAAEYNKRIGEKALLKEFKQDLKRRERIEAHQNGIDMSD